MHKEAYDFVAQYGDSEHVGYALEVGALDINASKQGLEIRKLWPGFKWYGIDVQAGPGVDEVADAARFRARGVFYDLVVACEVFEHTPLWPLILENMYEQIRGGGSIIITAASLKRPPHGVGTYGPGRYYGNVDPLGLEMVLDWCGFTDIVVETGRKGKDVYARARA